MSITQVNHYVNQTILDLRSSNKHKRDNTSTEIAAAIIAVPGAIAALITLWVLLRHARQRIRRKSFGF